MYTTATLYDTIYILVKLKRNLPIKNIQRYFKMFLYLRKLAVNYANKLSGTIILEQRQVKTLTENDILY